MGFKVVCVSVSKCLFPPWHILIGSFCPALYFRTAVWLQCAKKKSHRLHSEPSWDHFKISLNIFRSALEVSMFLSSTVREEVQTQRGITATRSEVLRTTFMRRGHRFALFLSIFVRDVVNVCYCEWRVTCSNTQPWTNDGSLSSRAGKPQWDVWMWWHDDGTSQQKGTKVLISLQDFRLEVWDGHRKLRCGGSTISWRFFMRVCVFYGPKLRLTHGRTLLANCGLVILLSLHIFFQTFLAFFPRLYTDIKRAVKYVFFKPINYLNQIWIMKFVVSNTKNISIFFFFKL